MKKESLFFFLFLFGICSIIHAQDIYQWRGKNRTGYYPDKNLLKEWPEKGPKMLWVTEDLGRGHSSPTITPDGIYLTGMRDTMDTFMALDKKGKKQWELTYAKAWDSSYPDSRCTPTLQGNKAYLLGGLGKLVCIDLDKRKIVWEIDGFKEFEANHSKWGIAEALLIVDNKLIYTPCGNITTMVALDKNTGETIWMSESLMEVSGYASPLLVERGGKKMVYTVTGKHVIGVDAENGKIMWKFHYAEMNPPGRGTTNHTNTPLYHNNCLFVTSGYDHYAIMLELSDDNKSVSLKWKNPDLDVHHGGVVKVGEYIYGANWTSNRSGNWVCLGWETGKTMYETEWHNKGPIIAADGMLYCYEEKGGNLALVEASPKGFNIKGSFKIPHGRGPHWSHPVIDEGKLYVRHENYLMVYDIRK